LHEATHRDLSLLVEVTAMEWGINLVDLGSATLRRADYRCGTDPDSCFYIRNVEIIAGKEGIELEAGDLAPDLVIEVDLTNPSLAKLPLYAEMGVSEVWRLSGARGDRLVILALHDGQYEEQEQSVAFTRLSRERLAEFVAQSRTMRRLDWIRSVRAWARQQAAEEASGASS
jgi:Uma2 family endonuclease